MPIPDRGVDHGAHGICQAFLEGKGGRERSALFDLPQVVIWKAEDAEEEAEVVDVEATHLTDAEDVEDEPEHVATDAKAIANKRRKRSYGCTGLKGVSRRIDTKTRNVSYQASVCFDNLTFRSSAGGWIDGFEVLSQDAWLDLMILHHASFQKQRCRCF